MSSQAERLAPDSGSSVNSRARPHATRCKVAIAHARLGRGGSEVYTMWGISALVKAGYDVTLLTLGSVELAKLNAWCGTSLANGDFRVLRPAYGPALRPALRAAAVSDSLLQRFCRRMAHQFDVLVSGYNPCDFGRPAVHLVQDFSWHKKLRREFGAPPADGSLRVHREGVLRNAYLGFAALLSNPSGRNLFDGQDFFVANSRWVSEISRQRCGFSHQQVVYPPVVFRSELLPHDCRDDDFVILGRVVHEKRIERAITIIERLRAMGHGVRLHIVGEIDTGTPYGHMIAELVQARSDWIVAEGCKVGAEKERTLMRHRYAIHACEGEAFGISVAELVKAGCIPFVPAHGGPAEIVATPQLCWSTIDGAVRAIDSLLRDPERQVRLRRHLADRGALFGTETFQDEFLGAVEQFVARNELRR